MSECPAWRLVSQNPHYLNVPNTTWERTEISRESGEEARITYTVPRLLDPENPRDCNNNGECVVYLKVEGAKIPSGKAWEFTGEPTPYMEALNDEAQAISDSLRAKWENPIETLPVNGGMSSAEQAFMEKMMLAFSGAAQAQNQAVPKEQYDALLDRMAKLEKMLEEKTAAPVPSSQSMAKPVVERRV